MKQLIFINGTMGVGKTTTCQILKNMLPKSVFLDGDWCWDMNPFVVNEETKNMVEDNICYLLNNFIHCSTYENIIFCWVMHEERMIENLKSKLDLCHCDFTIFTLICSEDTLIDRIQKDVQVGKRKEDVIPRALDRMREYGKMRTKKIDVSSISAEQAAKTIVIESRLDDSDCTAERVMSENQENLKMCQIHGCDYILIDNEYVVDIDLI